MTPEQARDEVLRLRGLFPTLTPQQGKFFLKELQKFELADVQQVVDEHFTRHDFFNSAQFSERLRSIAMRRAASKSEAAKAEDASVRREWEQIDRTIEAMEDRDLAGWKAHLLPTLPDGTKRMIGEKDPRHSATWKGLIYSAIKQLEQQVSPPDGREVA